MRYGARPKPSVPKARAGSPNCPRPLPGSKRSGASASGAPITGGSGGYVAEAVATDGTAAILKIAIPDGLQGQSPFARDVQTLRLGAGGSYVRVLQTDTRRRAMLQERLGRPLAALGYPVEEQIDIIAATLQRAWQPVPACRAVAHRRGAGRVAARVRAARAGRTSTARARSRRSRARRSTQPHGATRSTPRQPC